MIDYVQLSECNPDDLITILNSKDVRKHLIPHNLYNHDSLANWIKQKDLEDSIPGCRVRAILINQQLAGWCGIQKDKLGFEIGIVLDKPFWGHGQSVFKTMRSWARNFGHSELIVHLHESRPKYKFLSKIADNKITKSTIYDCKFNSYYIPV